MAFNFNNKEQSVEEFLNSTPYHSLKDELIKLGIDGVWKGGRKKADMIKEAVEKYEAIKQAIVESDTLVLSSDGNVWLGTQSPTGKLNIVGAKVEVHGDATISNNKDGVASAKVKTILDKKKEEERKKVLAKEYIASEPKRLMYDLLKRRHLKDGVLDKASVIASKEFLVNKAGNPKIISYQIDAHDMILKNYE